MTQHQDHRPFYITTAIPFVNARPHIGFGLEIILTDALARYYRLAGKDARFLTGADENSLKNVQAAEREGVSTAALVERNAGFFQRLREPLNLSFDDFIRTSADLRHRAGVNKLWEACRTAGDIYKQSYRGLYCVGCEQFYNEAELSDGLCPEHLTPPEAVEEENYFFRLSCYQDRLLELIESGRLHIEPEKRRNEVLSFIRAGLTDFSISRSRNRARGWGLPVPDDPEQVIYVWFDALGNYLTALDYADDGPLFQRYWANNPNRVHVIGKGIIRFHAVYWPAILLSAGLPLPSKILVHGYVTVEGRKIGKSLGNVVDPVALAETYGADTLRYYLLRHIRSTEDGDFSLERLVHAYNTELADQLGNLLRRTLTLIQRCYDGVVPQPHGLVAQDQALIEAAERLPDRVADAVERFRLDEALATIWELIGTANKYIAEAEPWRLAKCRDNALARNRLATILYNLVETLRLIACHCRAFLPATVTALFAQLGLKLESHDDLSWGGYPAGAIVRPGAILFPKREVDALLTD